MMLLMFVLLFIVSACIAVISMSISAVRAVGVAKRFLSGEKKEEVKLFSKKGLKKAAYIATKLALRIAKLITDIWKWVFFVGFLLKTVAIVLVGAVLLSSVSGLVLLNQAEDEEKQKTESSDNKRSDEEENKKVKSLLIIGDSRTVGMYHAVTGAAWEANEMENMPINATGEEGVRFLAFSGEGLNWFNDGNVSVYSGTSMATAGRRTITSGKEVVKSLLTDDCLVVFNLGVNDLFRVDKYIELMNEMSTWDVGAGFVFESINPINNTVASQRGSTSVSDSVVVEFNDKIKNNLPDNWSYLDTYTYIKPDVDALTAETADGLHYTNEIYQKLYDYIIDNCMAEQTENEESQEEAAREYDVVFVGDSRSMSMGSQALIEGVNNGIAYNVLIDDCINATWGDEVYSTNSLGNLKAALLKNKSNIVVLLGVNDVIKKTRGGYPPADITNGVKNSYRSLFNDGEVQSLLQNYQGTVYLMGISPPNIAVSAYRSLFRGRPLPDPTFSVRVVFDSVNAAIELFASDNNFKYIAADPAFATEDCFVNDGLHYTKEFYTNKFLPYVLEQIGLEY